MIKSNEDFYMSAVTENDLKEVKELISNLGNRLNESFNNLDEKITELRISQERVQTRLDDWKPSIDKTADLSEKIGELKNWRQIGIVLFTGLITSYSGFLKNRI